MTATQRAQLERIESHRLEPLGSDWEYSWHAARLASEIERANYSNPTAEAFGALWVCYQAAEACEQRLAKEGRTAVADNGETACGRIGRYLSSLSTASLKS